MNKLDNDLLAVAAPNAPAKNFSLAGMFVIGVWAYVAVGLLFMVIVYTLALGEQWYVESLASAQPVSWYAWPWSWPGPTGAENVLTYMGLSQGVVHTDPLLRVFSYMPRIFLATAINIFVAFLPLTFMTLVVRALIRMRSSKSA